MKANYFIVFADYFFLRTIKKFASTFLLLLSLQKFMVMKTRLREILREKGISEIEFAKELGVTPSYVNAVAAGRVNMSLKRLEQIADKLDVPLAAFFDGYNAVKELVATCPYCGKKLRIVPGEG